MKKSTLAILLLLSIAVISFTIDNVSSAGLFVLAGIMWGIKEGLYSIRWDYSIFKDLNPSVFFWSQEEDNFSFKNSSILSAITNYPSFLTSTGLILTGFGYLLIDLSIIKWYWIWIIGYYLCVQAGMLLSILLIPQRQKPTILQLFFKVIFIYTYYPLWRIASFLLKSKKDFKEKRLFN